jgi:spermidine/putrescine transport system ATP-binding protein
MAGLAGLITHRIFLGASAEYIVTVPGIGDVMVTTEAHVSSDNQRFDVGENVILTAEPTASNIFLD